MELKYLGKTIIAAVAQKPFVANDFTFCKLIPVFNPHEELSPVLSAKDFYNDGEIWWRLSSFAYSQHIVPGMLMEVGLEQAPKADAGDQNSSLYQARFAGQENVLGGKSGAEVFTLAGKTEASLADFKGTGGKITLPHVPSRQVFFRVAGSVYGPFATNLERALTGCQAQVLVKAFQAGRILKMDNAEFCSRYRILHAAMEVSTDQLRRRDSEQLAKVSWEYLPAEECAKIENDLSRWEVMDFEPLSTKIGRLTTMAGGFTRTEKRQIRALLDRLEQAMSNVEDPDKFRAEVERVGRTADGVEQNIRDLAKILVENGLLDEERVEEAKDAYLKEWIGTRTAEIDRAIEEEQHKLDEMRQEAGKKEAEFALAAKRQEKELQEKERKTVDALAKFETEERKRISAERANWEQERDKLKQEFDRQETAIAEMLEKVEGATDAQATDIVRVYPFLKHLLQPIPSSDQHAEATSSRPTPAPFIIPEVLKKSCRAAESNVKQAGFLKQLADLACARGFYYDTNDLRRFHTSVLCEGLTVLAGPSGVGKSSLARLYGEVISGGESAPRDGTLVIHVSPTWIERADLLGYVNTVTGEFSPSETGLYQRLIYAEEDFKSNDADSALYPICLDEMNLAQPEHYFSDFMQLLENPPESRILSCFSPEAVISKAVFRTHAQVLLPPSLRFIGTVNFDETTRRLSMRLLDRVNLIDLTNDIPARPFLDSKILPELTGVSYATYSSWIKIENLPPWAELCLRELAPYLRGLGASVSPRVRESMKRYIASSKSIIDPENPEKSERVAFDEQIAQRVLSKIRSLSSKRQEEDLDKVESILSNYCHASATQSGRVITALREQGRSFWYQRGDEDSGSDSNAF